MTAMKYLEIHNKSDLEEGDRVRFLRVWEEREEGYQRKLEEDLDIYIGMEATIDENYGIFGFAIIFTGDDELFLVPCFCLEKVEVKYEEISEIIDGEWVLTQRREINE
jgi:hypothetical protein